MGAWLSRELESPKSVKSLEEAVSVAKRLTGIVYGATPAEDRPAMSAIVSGSKEGLSLLG